MTFLRQNFSGELEDANVPLHCLSLLPLQKLHPTSYEHRSKYPGLTNLIQISATMFRAQQNAFDDVVGKSNLQF
jgi:hypothetical protein